jgi:hypothetical protein
MLQRKRITKIRFYVKKKIKISFLPLDIPPLISFSWVWPSSSLSSPSGVSCRMTYFCHLPQPFYDIDLFISFKLIFVKSFLMDITTESRWRRKYDEKDADRHEL